MIRVDNMSLVSSYTKQMTMKFDFSYDNGTPLPINTYTMGTTIYTIANGSTATNLKNGRIYVYDNGKWNINLTKSNTPNTSKTITNNGNYAIVNNDTFGMNNVKVNVSGGSSPTPSVGSRSDVNFYDYDGAIVNSYTKDEFLALSAMPENPTHEGLTAQGWNWDLEEAKQYVTEYGNLEIGQMYASNTTDSKTYLHIRLYDGRLKPYLGLTGNGEGTTVSIDWGDGSTSESVTLNTSTVYTPHEYTNSGEYIITISVISGTISLNGDGSTSSPNLFRQLDSVNANNDKAYANILTKAKIGNGVTSIGNFAFYNCTSLTSITIPSSVTSIGNNAFSYCYSLTLVTIPSEVTSIKDNAFNYCNSLKSVTIPLEVTSVGNNAFTGCNSLTSIAIPAGVTSIGSYAFNGCNSLTSITIPTGVTSIGYNTFISCTSLISITIPSSVTSIGKAAFDCCYSLISITIPSNITNIYMETFYSCYSLISITIPSLVTSIATYAFNSCYGLSFIKFESTTPPEVLNSNAWTNLPTNCKILVPTGSLSAYTSASNYPSSSTYTYEEYQPE